MLFSIFFKVHDHKRSKAYGYMEANCFFTDLKYWVQDHFLQHHCLIGEIPCWCQQCHPIVDRRENSIQHHVTEHPDEDGERLFKGPGEILGYSEGM